MTRSSINLLLAATSGLLVALAFPPYALWPLVFVTFVPLLVAVEHSSPGRAAGLGWLSGVVVHLGAFPWLLATIARFEHASSLLTLPFVLLFIAYHSLQLAGFGLAAAWLTRREPSILRACLVACAWVLLEWGFPRVFPWFLANPLADSPLLRQAADIGGAYGLTWVIVFVNGCVAGAVIRWRAASRSWRPLLAALTVILALIAYGARQLARQAGPGAARPQVLVTLVQGAIPWGPEDIAIRNERAWQQYEALTRNDLGRRSFGDQPRPDLIVWPETSLRVYLNTDDRFRKRVQSLVDDLRTPLLLGALDVPAQGSGELNSAYLIQPRADGVERAATALATQVYHKQDLVAFGEYVPGASWLPLLHRWHTSGDFVSASPSAARPLTLALTPSRSSDGSGPLSIAPSICFEAVQPGAANGMVRDGATVLINLTDDSWFGSSAEPAQHLQATVLRAVETRRWLVRASGSGISAFIDPGGTITAALPLGTVGVSSQHINQMSSQPFFVRWGNWVVAMSATLLLLAGVRLFLG